MHIGNADGKHFVPVLKITAAKQLSQIGHSVSPPTEILAVHREEKEGNLSESKADAPKPEVNQSEQPSAILESTAVIEHMQNPSENPISPQQLTSETPPDPSITSAETPSDRESKIVPESWAAPAAFIPRIGTPLPTPSPVHSPPPEASERNMDDDVYENDHRTPE